MRAAIVSNPTKVRLDLLLVRQGQARSRQAAQALVMSGRVSVDGAVIDKPGTRVAADASLLVTPPDRVYVGRGGHKLAGALDSFSLDVTGWTVLDVGASTGGFTDCLLQRGARTVIALDVGRGQLDWSLRRDPRVRVLEGVNARYLQASMLPPRTSAVDMATVDVSFISLRLVMGSVADVAPRIVALVKPQFEAGRGQVGRGGIIRDPAIRRAALENVTSYALEHGLGVLGLAPSHPPGAEGNREYFVHLVRGAGGLAPEEIADHVRSLTRPEE